MDFDDPDPPVDLSDVVHCIKEQTRDLREMLEMLDRDLSWSNDEQTAKLVSAIEQLKTVTGDSVRKLAESVTREMQDARGSGVEILREAEHLGGEIAGTTSEVMTLGNIVNLRAAWIARWTMFQSLVLLLILWRAW